MRDRVKTFLSKSKYIEGLQCPKLLWCEYHAQDLFPSVDPASRFLFDEGKRVGALAQALFPSGLKIAREVTPEQHHAKSLAALKQRQPLFDAGFVFERAYAIADILDPVEGGAWNLYAVKSATQVKEEYLHDVAFQKFTYVKAGVKIRRCFIMYINTAYVRQGALEPEKLFVIKEVTEAVDDLREETAHKIKSMCAILGLPKPLEVGIGPFCDEPNECGLKKHCWKFLPEKNHVFALSRGRKLAFELVSQGVVDILNIPREIKLSDKQLLQIECHRQGKPHIDKPVLREFLARLRYPVYFLDFETIAPAIPVYDLSRPYEMIPFQFSMYTLYAGGYAVPRAFLAEGTDDPRPEILRQLRQLLNSTGSIVAYNAQFEIHTLENAAGSYPEYKEWFRSLESRFVDLLEPFRGFAYYHPRQEGSNSIKHVLPAVTGTSYGGMEIANGALASNEYARVTFNRDIPDAERLRVRAALTKYCDLDTRGMLEIISALGKIVE